MGGHLTFAVASPAAGRAYTDHGQVHEHRGLKAAPKADPPRTPAGPQARPQGPHPAPARRAPPHPHRDVRHRPGRGAVPVRDRQPHPALHLAAGLAESPGRRAHPRPARLPAHETPIRPAPLRDHLAAQLRHARHRSRRLGRSPRRNAHAGLRDAWSAWKASGSAAWTKACTWRSHDLGRVWGSTRHQTTSGGAS